MQAIVDPAIVVNDALIESLSEETCSPRTVENRARGRAGWGLLRAVLDTMGREP